MTLSTLSIVLTWLCFGICAMNTAEHKGLNKGLGFVLGFIFGIFGLLVVAIIPKKESSEKTVDEIMKSYINKED
jgi:hypothetical protein